MAKNGTSTGAIKVVIGLDLGEDPWIPSLLKDAVRAQGGPRRGAAGGLIALDSEGQVAPAAAALLREFILALEPALMRPCDGARTGSPAEPEAT